MPAKKPLPQAPVIPVSPIIPGQDNVTPQPKVIAATVAGAVTTLVAWALRQAGLDISAEVQGAFTTLFVALSGYFTSNR